MIKIILGILLLWGLGYSLAIGTSPNVIYISIALAGIVGLSLYLIMNISLKVEHLLYALMFAFFVLITVVIIIAFTGQTIWCSVSFPMTGAIFAFIGFILFGSLNFNLVFRNKDLNNNYDKLLILLLFFLSTFLLIKWIRWSLDESENIVRVIKFMIIPAVIYVICMN